jgi:hypothetical protein
VLALLRHPDREDLRDLIADDVRFHSPVADYRGRADVSHLLMTIAGVLDSVEATREVSAGSTCTTFIAGSVGGHAITGVLDEHFDGAGRVAEVTLLLRPLSALHVAVRAMREALSASPLPSSTR